MNLQILLMKTWYVNGVSSQHFSNGMMKRIVTSTTSNDEWHQRRLVLIDFARRSPSLFCYWSFRPHMMQEVHGVETHRLINIFFAQLYIIIRGGQEPWWWLSSPHSVFVVITTNQSRAKWGHPFNCGHGVVALWATERPSIWLSHFCTANKNLSAIYGNVQGKITCGCRSRPFSGFWAFLSSPVGEMIWEDR